MPAYFHRLVYSPSIKLIKIQIDVVEIVTLKMLSAKAAGKLYPYLIKSARNNMILISTISNAMNANFLLMATKIPPLL